MRCKACNKEIEEYSLDELLEYCNKCFNECLEYYKEIKEKRKEE